MTKKALPKHVHHPSKRALSPLLDWGDRQLLVSNPEQGCLEVRAWLELFWCRFSGRLRQYCVFLGQRPEGAVLGVERAVVPSPCVPPGAMQ